MKSPQKWQIFAFFTLCVQSLYAIPLLTVRVQNAPEARILDIALTISETAQTPPPCYRITPKKNGESLTFGLETQTTQWIWLEYNGTKFQIFVEANDDLQMSFDANDIEKTLHFEGNGAANNNAIAQFRQLFQRNEPTIALRCEYLPCAVDVSTIQQAATLSLEDFKKDCNARHDIERSWLEAQKPNLHKSVYAQLWKDAHYTDLIRRMTYPLQREYWSCNDIAAARKTLDLDRNFDFADYQRDESAALQNALSAFLHLECQQLITDGEQRDAHALFALADKKFDGFHRFQLQKQLLLEARDRFQDVQLAKHKFANFERDAAAFPDMIADVRRVYGQDLNVLQSETAPDFEFTTADGQKMWLHDLRGKVVYLDFWASWCAPCITGFKKYAPLRQQLLSEGVVLLNVSIDDFEEKYRNAVQTHQPQGISALPTDIKAVRAAYQVYSVPSYHIIDKNGQFTYLSDDLQRDVLTEFRKILQR